MAAGAAAVAISASSPAHADEPAVPMVPDEPPARAAPLPDATPRAGANDYLPNLPPPTGAPAPISQPRREPRGRGHPGLGLLIGGGAALTVGIPLLIGGAVLVASNRTCSELCLGAPIGGAMAVLGGVATVTGFVLLIAGASASGGDSGGAPEGWARLAPAVVVAPNAVRLGWSF